MRVAIFGANGNTGRILVGHALARGHSVNAVVRDSGAFPLHHERLQVFQADVMDGASLIKAVGDCAAVASVLGASYSFKPIVVYSRGTRAIAAAMDLTGCKRIAVVSSGLTYAPPAGYGFLFDKIIHPLLHNVIGRTLYADMRAMEELLCTRPDLEWIVMRPGRLVDGDTGRPYKKEPETPSRRFTTRRDLAKAMLDDLESGDDIHRAVAVTSR
ncbi:MAG: NAD(P)H-binding protein [Kofleriaceae bacterium]